MTIYDINDRLDTIVQQLGDCVLFTQEKKIDITIALNLLSDLTELSVDIQAEIQEEYIDEYEEYIDTEYEKNMPCDNTGLCSNTCPMYYQCNT